MRELCFHRVKHNLKHTHSFKPCNVLKCRVHNIICHDQSTSTQTRNMWMHRPAGMLENCPMHTSCTVELTHWQTTSHKPQVKSIYWVSSQCYECTMNPMNSFHSNLFVFPQPLLWVPELVWLVTFCCFKIHVLPPVHICPVGQKHIAQL